MDGSPPPPLSPAQRKELHDRLREVWLLGANIVIGWRAAPGAVELVYVPSLDLPLVARRHGGLLEPNRHIGDRNRYDTLRRAGCLCEVVPLTFDLGEDEATADQMGSILRYYTVTHSRCRGVALFDIVSFSHQSPFVQISQINILSHHANLAASCLESAGLPIDLNMSTTGDGFYVWNRKTGLAEDLALFYATSLVLAFNKAATIDKPENSIPALRCCFGFGDHYEYYQASGTKPDSRGFIVGDVTVTLARLIGAALPNQFLISRRARETGESDDGGDAPPRIEILSFWEFAQSNAELLAGLPLADAKIGRVAFTLTGDRASETESSINVYDVIDKHGFENRCLNARVSAHDSRERRIDCGLATEDLASFGARRAEEDDVRIKTFGAYAAG